MTAERRARRLLTVGLTGGIGAGKSEALRAFARHGAATASADAIVHRLYDDPQLQELLVERWGSGIRRGDGTIDRGAVAERVFGSRDELAWLESVLHPRVVAEQANWREELAARADPPAVAVVEVPLLYETGAETRFDAVVVITAPEEIRKARTAVADPAKRAARMLPDEEKATRADFAYVNDGSLDDLDAFVREVLSALEAR